MKPFNILRSIKGKGSILELSFEVVLSELQVTTERDSCVTVSTVVHVVFVYRRVIYVAFVYRES